MKLEPLTEIDAPGWLQLRLALWPDSTADAHRDEMRWLLDKPEQYVQYIVRSPDQQALGFAEASLRNDYVNGTESSPVCFLEGLYVAPEARRQGVARKLVLALANWAIKQGCTEFASDTPLDNRLSQSVHRKLGFQETERVVYFNMPLDPRRAS